MLDKQGAKNKRKYLRSAGPQNDSLLSALARGGNSFVI